MEKFTSFEPFAFAWSKVKNHLKFVVLSTLGVLVITGLFNLSGSEPDTGIEALYSLIGFIVSIFVQTGVIRLALKLTDDVEGGVQDFLPSWKMFWNLLLGGIVYGLVVGFGFLLLIVPGIIWALRYGQVFYLIIDKDMGPIEALKESARMTYGSKKKIFLVGIISLGLVLLGILALVVGLLITLPVIAVAWAYVYKKLVIPVPKVVEEPVVRPVEA